MVKMVRTGWNRTPTGTSTWLASQLEPGRDQNPDVFAMAEPIYTWARMVLDPAVQRSVMEQAFLQQQRIHSSGQDVGVAGPAGAVIKILAQLNWRIQSPFLWTTANGVQLDLEEVSPDWVRTQARRSFEHVKWEEWATKVDHNPETTASTRSRCGYWLAPSDYYLHQMRSHARGSWQQGQGRLCEVPSLEVNGPKPDFIDMDMRMILNVLIAKIAKVPCTTDYGFVQT